MTRGGRGKPPLINEDVRRVFRGQHPERMTMRLFALKQMLVAFPNVHEEAAERVMAEAAQIWHDVKDDLTVEFLKRHPGQRPIAFYKFELDNEPRAIVRGHGVILPRDPCLAGWPENFMDPTAEIWLESSASQLKRHGLLLKSEEKVLPPSAFEPRQWKTPTKWTTDELAVYRYWRRFPGDYDPRPAATKKGASRV